MTKKRFSLYPFNLIFFMVISLFACRGVFAANEWPAFKNGLNRSSVNPASTLSTPFALKWSTNPVGTANAVAYSSPVMLNGNTYIGSIEGSILAFKGNVTTQPNAPLWTYKTDGSIYGSPAAATIGGQDYVFVGSTDGNLFGLNATTGALVFKQNLGGAIFSSPIIVFESTTNTTLVLSSTHAGYLYAFNVSTPSAGVLLWSKDLGNDYLFASPAYDSTDDLVFEPSYSGTLYALHVALSQAGQIAWQATVGPTRSTPAVTASYVYNLNANGILSCFVKNSGTLKATVDLGSTTASSPAAYRVSGATADTIITGDDSGKVRAWSLPDSGSNFSLLWQSQEPKPIYSSPAVSSPDINNPSLGGVVYVGCDDGNLYGLNLATGAAVTTIAFGKTVQISPAVAEGNLLVSSGTGIFQDYAPLTPTPTPTMTGTLTITTTPTITGTVTETPSITITGTVTTTPTVTGSITTTPSITGTQSISQTETVTNTPSGTITPVVTSTSTPTGSITPTVTNTPSGTLTTAATFTFTSTGSTTPTASFTSTGTLTPIVTDTFTATLTDTDTPTGTITPSITPTNTVTDTFTWTPTGSFTDTFTPTVTGTPATATPTSSSSPNCCCYQTVSVGVSHLFYQTAYFPMAADSAGNVYIAVNSTATSNSGSFPYNEIEKFDPCGNLLGTWTGPGGSRGTFTAIARIALSPDGQTVYVDDTTSAGTGIDTFNTTGVYQSTVSGSATIDAGGGLAVDGSGDIYTGSLNNGTVAEYTAAGSFVKYLYNSTIAGTGYQGSVQAIAVDGSGNLFVGDFNVIHKIDIATATQVWAKGGNFTGNACIPVVTMNDIFALGTDSSGNVYELDQNGTTGYSNFTNKLDTNGNLLCTYQIQDSNPSSIVSLLGMAVQPDGVVEAADPGDHQLVEFIPCGTTLPSCASTPTATGTPLTSTPTATPSGTIALSKVWKAFAAGEATSTPTPSPTLSPTATENPLLKSVVAAPNISRDGEPINFLVNLKNPATIHVYIFSIAGEEIYSTTDQGNTGENRIHWNVTNTQGSKLSSGLYLYVIDIADGSNDQIYRGKMAIIN